MTTTELNELIITKLGIKPWGLNNEPFGVRFDYRGSRYFVDINLMVEKVDGACLVTDSDARQLEKLLRGEQWDGTGLPPVGTECEYKDTQTGEWMPVNIKYASDQIVVLMGCERLWGTLVEIAKDVVIDKPEFRPLRTERDNAIEKLRQILNVVRNTYEDAENLYDAIVAGKIDGLGKVG